MRATTLSILMAVLSFVCSYSLLGVSIEAKAKLGREYAPKGPVIKCGPKAEGDILSVSQAMAQLKPGSTLILTPGRYTTAIPITVDKVLITGDDSGKKCDVNITVSGRDCVLRGLWIGNLIANRDIIVVDSLFDRFISGRTIVKNESLDQYIYNTGILSVISYLKDTKIFMKQCVVMGLLSSSPIGYDGNLRITIANSVVASKKTVVDITESHLTGKGKGKLTLDNCDVYGAFGLGKLGHHSEKVAFTFKELKRLATVSIKGETIIKKPSFVIDALDPDKKYYYIKPRMFIPAGDSPKKDRGIDVDTHPILSKYLSPLPQPPAKPVHTQPPVKPKPPTRPPEKPKTPVKPKVPPKSTEKNDSGLGGIPDAPEE